MKKRGRPPLPDKYKKCCLVHIRCTPAMKKTLVAAARKRGFSLSMFLLNAAFWHLELDENA